LATIAAASKTATNPHSTALALQCISR
jgi:hypothetical protein